MTRRKTNEKWVDPYFGGTEVEITVPDGLSHFFKKIRLGFGLCVVLSLRAESCHQCFGAVLIFGPVSRVVLSLRVESCLCVGALLVGPISRVFALSLALLLFFAPPNLGTEYDLVVILQGKTIAIYIVVG